MSVKILSRAGSSLADTYNVVGGVAGLDRLETRETTTIHEMGGTIFSERLSGAIRRATTGPVNQSTAFDITMTGLPAGIFRVLGVTVISSSSARVDNVQLALRDPDSGRELPFFVWDDANDVAATIRIVENGGAAGNQVALIAPNLQIPNLGIGERQRQRVGEEIVMRGQTNAFGAGTNTLIGLVYVGFTHRGGISSRGLPIPGW